MNRLVSAVVFFFASAGCGSARDNDIPNEAREVFDKATEFELYSIDPSRLPKKDDGEKAELFHGWKVLGKTTVKGDDVKKIRAAIERGAKDSDGSVAACFNPRHGVRIVSGKKTYDLVICYECLSATVYSGEEKIGSFLTTGSPAKTLNKALKNAKVTLAKE